MAKLPIVTETPFSESTELSHHGVKGMHWGIRKARGSSGSSRGGQGSGSRANPLARGESTKSGGTSRTAPAKQAKQMSDQELAAALQRVRMETEYARLSPTPEAHPLVSRGTKIAQNIMFNGIEQAGTQIVKHYAMQTVKTLDGSYEKNDKNAK